MTSEILLRLQQVLPSDAISTDSDLLSQRAMDHGEAPSSPAAVLVRPRTTQEVSAIMEVACELDIPVVPQGALTGLAGGANSSAGCVLLSLENMNQIVRIDPVDQTATVQAGVITQHLAQAVAAVGMFYPPDPASHATSQIGGNIATNAGGMHCVKYGVTRDFVRGLEVVLANGEVIRTGQATVKGVAGLDLTGLMVGSEGTLGIITEATLGLIPQPGPKRGLLATFPNTATAMHGANLVVGSPQRPATVEFIDSTVIGAINAYRPEVALPEGAQGVLIVLTDSLCGAEQDLAAYRKLLEQAGAEQIITAHDEDEVAQIMAARRLLNPAMRKLRGDSLDEDVAVPRSKLPQLLAELEKLASELNLPIGTAGHIGDGNLHPVIAYDSSDDDQARRAQAGHLRIMELALDLGGTITGEHGIGLAKREMLEPELGRGLLRIQQQIKDALDPKGISNPGKKL